MNPAMRQIVLDISGKTTSGEVKLDDSRKIVWQIVSIEPAEEGKTRYRTPLGKKLGEIKKKIASSGASMMNREELDQEIASRKGRRDEENIH